MVQIVRFVKCSYGNELKWDPSFSAVSESVRGQVFAHFSEEVDIASVLGEPCPHSGPPPHLSPTALEGAFRSGASFFLSLFACKIF